MNIDYCSRCKKIYAKNSFGLCGNCLREIEDEYERCHKFLKENRMCSINELSEKTSVSIKQITKFIREGRISIADAPNMDYPCEICGNVMIREGNMCESCRNRLAKEVRHMHEDDRRRAELQQQNKITFQINRKDLNK